MTVKPDYEYIIDFLKKMSKYPDYVERAMGQLENVYGKQIANAIREKLK